MVVNMKRKISFCLVLLLGLTAVIPIQQTRASYRVETDFSLLRARPTNINSLSTEVLDRDLKKGFRNPVRVGQNYFDVRSFNGKNVSLKFISLQKGERGKNIPISEYTAYDGFARNIYNTVFMGHILKLF